MQHFLSINNQRLEPSKVTPKKALISQATNFLQSSNFLAFPGILIYANNSIFIFPVILKHLKNKPEISEFSQSKTVHQYKQFLTQKLITITINERTITNLQLDKKLPPFISSDFCLNFCSFQLKPTLSKLFELTPNSKRTQAKRDYSFNENLESSAYTFSDSESNSDSEIDLFNTATTLNTTKSTDTPKKLNPEIKMADSDESASAKIEQNETHEIPQQITQQTPENTPNITTPPISISQRSTPQNTSYSTPKIKLTNWSNATKDGDPIDWLRIQLYVINLNKGNLSEGAIIQLLLGAINATELKSKIISELAKLSTAHKTSVKEFENIFKKNVKRDVITYRNYLKKLRYTEDVNMREFYSKIYGLVAKSLELDEDKDALSIEKLAIDEFISKIPKDIREALQTSEFNNGFDLAQAAERCRSYQRVYLDKNTQQINKITVTKPQKNTKKFTNNFNKNTTNDYNNTRNNHNSRGNNSRGNSNYQSRGNYQSRNTTNYRPNAQNSNSRNNYQNNTSRNYQNNNNQNYNSRNQTYNHRNNGQNFRGNSRGNFRGNFGSRGNYRNFNSKPQNALLQRNCKYCKRNGHMWDECRTLSFDISRGNTTPNWEPSYGRHYTNNMLALQANSENNTNEGGMSENPMFATN